MVMVLRPLPDAIIGLYHMVKLTDNHQKGTRAMKIITNIKSNEDGYQIPVCQVDSKTTSWMAQGSCNGIPTNVFYDETIEGVRFAKSICETCPVQKKCLDYAVSHAVEEGVWGGKSGNELRSIRMQARHN